MVGPPELNGRVDAAPTRRVRDAMGEMQVPAGAYYGASTMRAVLNFPVSTLRFPRVFIRALGLIKLAAAQTNRELDLLDTTKAGAIEAAAREVADGRLDDQFVVDVFQTGSGTSTNMNANEVIASRASELISGDRGSGDVHPNDDVNLCQSSNDVIPTAIRIAALLLIREELEPSLEELRTSLRAKQDEFWGVFKTGRTHLQDATPIRLGQEFLGYSGQIERSLRRLEYAVDDLAELPLGGTAVGTGINCHPDFPERAAELLSELSGLELHETDNHFQAQATIDGLVAASGMLRTIAVSLSKIADDIRWLGSGPRTGLGELKLPEVQPGSSIMPGKVNPVIAESLLQACAQVIANDSAIVLAGRDSRFELNLMLPLAGHNLLQSLALLTAPARNFDEKCVRGLQATDQGPKLLEQGLALATALAPEIGYDQASAIAKEASATGETVLQVAIRRTTLSELALKRLLDPETMTEPSQENIGAGGA
ncbi:MAG: class II fumarate hydratase [Dehalococcoidia bacterium]